MQGPPDIQRFLQQKPCRQSIRRLLLFVCLFVCFWLGWVFSAVPQAFVATQWLSLAVGSGALPGCGEWGPSLAVVSGALPGWGEWGLSLAGVSGVCVLSGCNV